MIDIYDMQVLIAMVDTGGRG